MNPAEIDTTVAEILDVYEARHIKRRRASQTEMSERLAAIEQLAEEHQPCSVRHLFYRATVAKVPSIGKDRAGYCKVQRAVLQLRRAGRIPYSWITDNSRTPFMLDVWGGVNGFLDDMAGLYRRDLWHRSPYRVEVWCESDSIAGTLIDVTQRWRVPLYPIKGQSSETFAYNAVQSWLAEKWRQVIVLYVGDHDPAGLEIEQSLYDKMLHFASGTDSSSGMYRQPMFVRLGVTWQQVLDYDLPGTAPKKRYGYPLAVEAEALPPRVLRDLVDETIGSYVDPQQLRTLLAVERHERELLLRLSQEYVPEESP